eukprot:gnl/MRDRNA2_/MRDRNA2_131763_c0_seq1.p1 gnl/MRDRNA2_/MRDRNA2_131763_c0~~gnl/MRDRNA2_/MRDRNA2_131763_c0_seq1.p1  ORF type:complete len:318 (-),score=51.09 gnl/MRDRNA2_/MRDRNA2_131763_c0_seq1:46-888(-)
MAWEHSRQGTVRQFSQLANAQQRLRRRVWNVMQPPAGAASDDTGEKPPKKGYQFGDLSKAIFEKTAKAVTGNENYKFGDATKSIVGKTTAAINDFTGKEKYEFGDLARSLDQKAKQRAAEFTGKDGYEVGDISKEIVRRARSGEYDINDMILLCKILLTLGVEFSPIANQLPIKFILEIMNVSLGQEVSDKFMGVLATNLDKRMKEAMTGDSEYQIGDLTKKAILRFIGKDNYEFGDLSRAVAKKMEDKEDLSKSLPLLDSKLVAELDEWDRARSKGSAK